VVAHATLSLPQLKQVVVGRVRPGGIEGVRIRVVNSGRRAEIVRLAAAIRMKVAQCLEAMDPTTLRPNEVARLLEVASRVERMARGVLPDEPVVRPGFHFNAEEVRRRLKEDGFLLGSAAGESPP
jgi:hypothetical protein